MKAVIQQLLQQLSAPTNALSEAEVKLQLLPHINHLMDTNFMQFVQTLYELDIDENKILHITQQQAMHAGQIADLIIARELQKIETRKQYKKDTLDAPPDLLL
jgi:hypothetical protein